MRWYKWPSTLHWSAGTTPLRADRGLIWLATRKGSPVVRPAGRPQASASGDSVLLCSGVTPWVARWYLQPSRDGRASKYSCYVDVTTCPLFANQVIAVVDLDLDVAVLDEEEFLEHTTSLGYPDWLVRQARRSCREVQDRLATKAPPFDGQHTELAVQWAERCQAEPSRP
jgi:uncharacterized protein